MSSRPHITSVFYNDPDQYPPIVNGTHLLARAEYEGTLLCRMTFPRWNVTYAPEITVQRLESYSPSSWAQFISFVSQTLRVANPRSALFIGHDMHGFLSARLLAWRYRRPLIYHCHDFAQNDSGLLLGGRVVKAFEQRFARTADLVIVPDSDRAVVIQQSLRLASPPVIVANAPLQNRIQDRSRLRQVLLEQGHSFSKIVWRQGRIGEGHALEATIRSIPQWREPSWGFVFMGTGDPVYRVHLETLADDLGVRHQVVILPPVSYDEIFHFTGAAHIGHAMYEPIHVNNQYITTASNKLMEYMAASLPLLVSDRPSLRTFVEHHACGVVADEADPGSIAAAVNTLLGDEARAQRMGQAGRKAFEEVFSYDLQFQPALQAIKSLTAQRG